MKALGWATGKIGVKGGVILGTTVGGAILSGSKADLGLKGSAIKEGAIGGALLGGSLILAPKAIKGTTKEIAASGKTALKAVQRKGQRKIRGFYRKHGKVRPIYG